jgi:hypothetical protein
MKLKGLACVCVAQNRISKLDEGIFDHMDQLHTVELDENKFSLSDLSEEMYVRLATLDYCDLFES